MRLKVDIKSMLKQYVHKTRVIISAKLNYCSQHKQIHSENKSNDDENWRLKLYRKFDEQHVGITEFIGRHNAFIGFIKHRHEDFVVHEITKTGEIVRLTDLSVPPLLTAPVIDIYEVLDDQVIYELHRFSINLKEIDCENEESLKTPTDTNTNERNCDKHETGIDFITINITNKHNHERLKIVKAIRDHFPNVDVSTINENNEKFIRIGRSKYFPQQKSWFINKGNFVHFTLYKENVEMHYAINLLANRLHVTPKYITYSGTKDRRAITTQRVCAWKIAPNRIASAVEGFRNIKVGNFSFEDKPLELGSLSGNHFDIVLRDVVFDNKDDAENALKSVRDNGFVNYYGMQRFGYTYDKPHSVGVLILQQKWKEVVDELLKPKFQDRIPKKSKFMSLNQCLEMWQNTRDAKQVYKKLVFKYTKEGLLLYGLTKVDPNDYHGALCMGLPPNQRHFPLHCLTSYLWNCIASYRIQTYGTNVVIGDLLTKNSSLDKEEYEEDINSDIYYADESNIENASIYDVVIPLIGSLTLLPKNSTAHYINSLLDKERITIDMFRDLPKEWDSEGKYRKLLAKPIDMSWKWITYTDPNQVLLEREIDSHIETEFESELIGADLEQTDSTHNLSERIGLIVSFSLLKSCYATVMLREMTKTEHTDLEIKPWLSRVGAQI